MESHAGLTGSYAGPAAKYARPMESHAGLNG
jgi:hypothetical protein